MFGAPERRPLQEMTLLLFPKKYSWKKKKRRISSRKKSKVVYCR